MRAFSLAFLMSIGTAMAQTPPTIDMTQVLLDEKGKPIIDAFEGVPDTKDPTKMDCSKCSELTLGRAIEHALFTVGQSEANISGDQKFARAVLAERIVNDKAAHLTAAEITLIKREVGLLYNPLLIWRIFPLIDPNSKPGEVN